MAIRKPTPDTAVEQVDTSYLEGLVGYNARRATLVIVDAFLRNMAVYGLKPVEFSVLSLIAHNPGITECANRLSAGEHIDNMPTCAVFTACFRLDDWSALEWESGLEAEFDYPRNFAPGIREPD